jgi:hypothetical protein
LYGSVDTGSAHFALSADGTLVYLEGPPSAAPTPVRDLAVLRPPDIIEALKLPPKTYELPRI